MSLKSYLNNKLLVYIGVCITVIIISLGFFITYNDEDNRVEEEKIKPTTEEYSLPDFDEESIGNTLINKFDTIKNKFISEDIELLKQHFQSLTDENYEYTLNYTEDIKYSIRNTYVESFNLDYPEVSDTVEVNIGQLKLNQENCNNEPFLDVIYNINTEEISFGSIFSFLEVTCTYQEIISQDPDLIIQLNCTDCFYAPVDKVHKLPESYIPEVVPIEVHGGGYLTQKAKNALLMLIDSAEEENIYPTLTSSYRSYSLQEDVFERWVQFEINKGYSRSQAEARANVYSAKPGHSEHQLGTTVDMRCLSCEAFTNSQGNQILYTYLEENAHKFGFVISYPPNAEEQTGYKHEPWHLRYIGVDLATELFERNYITSNGEEYLAKFLREKALY